MSPLPDPTPQELSLARKLARQGESVVAIHAALGWACSPKTTWARLKGYGIKISSRKLAHHGAATSVGREARVDHRSYRPGAGRAGP